MKRTRARTGVWIASVAATLACLSPASRAEERPQGERVADPMREGPTTAAVTRVAPGPIPAPSPASESPSSRGAQELSLAAPAHAGAPATPRNRGGLAPTAPAGTGSPSAASEGGTSTAASPRSAARVAAPASEADWRMARAETTVHRLLFAGDHVQRALRDARARSGPPTERQSCLDEVLSGVHMAARAGREVRDELVLALAGGDLRRADLALIRITALEGRAKRLVARAATCGASATGAGPTLPGGSAVRVLSPQLPAADDLPRLD